MELKKNKCLDLAAYAYLKVCFKEVMHRKLINLLRSILLENGGSVRSLAVVYFSRDAGCVKAHRVRYMYDAF